jgi:general secretion pathway protein D
MAARSAGKLMFAVCSMIAAALIRPPRAVRGVKVIALWPLVFLAVCCAFSFALQGAEATAPQLAREARKAQNAGLVVRAWMLYSEAARIDPANPAYRTERDALAPFARMLAQAGVQTEESSLSELRGAAVNAPEEKPAFEYPAPGELERIGSLRPPPDLKPRDERHSFETRGDEKTLFHQVANAYGVNVVFDVALQPKANLSFSVSSVNFREAMEALTLVTNTFLFAAGDHTIFVARDEKLKRDQFEPEVALSIPLPDATDDKGLNDATTAVKGALESQRILLNGATRCVIIHDRFSKAMVARGLLEALIRPRSQVSVDFQLLSLDETVSLQYGLGLPTSYPVISLGNLAHFQNIISAPSGFTEFLKLGGGLTTFGLGITNATVFATSSRSWTKEIYEAQVLAADGQPATLNVGEKYPIATALSTAPASAFPSVASTPVAQTTQQDLGVKLKVTPHVMEDGEIALDVEAEYNSLGSLTLNSVPIIDQRIFKGSVRLLPGEWAVVAGMDAVTRTISRTGIPGLGDIPWLRSITAQNTVSSENSRLLIVLKPHLTRLPASAWLSPQFVYGSENGSRVLL